MCKHSTNYIYVSSENKEHKYGKASYNASELKGYYMICRYQSNVDYIILYYSQSINFIEGFRKIIRDRLSANYV